MLHEPLIRKSSFIGLEDRTWLYSGAETPPHRGCVEAMLEYMNNRALGPAGRDRNAEIEQSLRQNMAQLLNGHADDIALISNASEGISLIMQALDLKEGDNVVIHTLEFPSGVYPWLRLKEKGVEVRLIEHTDWQIEVEDIMHHVDSRTKLVMTSHVSFSSGTRIDYPSLYEQLKNTDTLLFVDATQSLGAIPVDMQAADFIVCSSYKWLLSIHGLGILAINPARTSHLLPKSAGWRSVVELFYPDRFSSFTFHHDARRFELGYPSYPTIYAMNYSSSLLLEIGIDRIEKRILALGTLLIDRLNDLGYQLITPSDPHKRAGNISFVCEDGENVAAMLLEHNVYVWGGDGRIRASLHVFNDTEDVDRFVQLLAKHKALKA